jgi:hypothetical protein
VCAIWTYKPLARWRHYHLLNSWILWVLNIPECGIPGCGAICWSLKMKRCLWLVSAAWQKYVHFSMLPHTCQFSQLGFSITMIASTLQQTFFGHLNTRVCIISHFCIQVDSLQCYFFWENSFDVWKCLYWVACWQASFRGAHGKIAFLFASVVGCIWQPKCRDPKGTHIIFFFLSWLLLLLNSGSLILLVLLNRLDKSVR